MAGLIRTYSMGGLLDALYKPPRRKVFVCYHHGGDQVYYNEFSRFFHDQFETVFDNSLDRLIDSDNVDYVMQQIRDNHLTGTSCTVVLIGAQSHLRKYVDWEIKATLTKQHGLVGVILPTCVVDAAGKFVVPDRFFDNCNTGYAVLERWQNLTIPRLNQVVEQAISKPKSLIDNSQPMRQRNG